MRHAAKERFDPASAKSIPVDGSPSKWPEDAQVTIIELADFPSALTAATRCRSWSAVLDAHPGKGAASSTAKTYTLPFHTRGEPAAARAAFAAGEKQGKFWEMEHILFERQQHLEDADLERYARHAPPRHSPSGRRSMDAPDDHGSRRIARDRKLGEDLKLRGTPTIFVNGRELDSEAEEPLELRVDSELGVPVPGESAAPAPSAPPAPNASSKGR